MRSRKLSALLVTIMFLFAACNQTPAPEAALAPELEVATTLPGDDSTQVCPNTGQDDPAWTKIDRSSGSATGDFGSFTYSGNTLTYNLNEGYTLQFCVKSGSQVGTIYREVTGAGTITIRQDISHVSWRVVAKPSLKKLVDLSVSKGAEASYKRTVEWTLTKTVNGQEIVSFTGKPGDEFSATWKVVATKTKDVLSDYSVVGEITVTNPNPVAVDVSVADVLDDSTLADVDCDSPTDGNQASGTVPANGSLTCSYTASPIGKDATLNTATVTVAQGSYTVPQNYDGKIEGGKATAPVSWGDPILVGDPNPLLEDLRPVFNYSKKISDTTELVQTETFTCPAYSETKYPNDMYSETAINTATLTGEGLNLSASATVNVTCKVTWKDETATGQGPRWPKTNNWFMYTPYTTNKVDLIAGQTFDAGDIFMRREGTTTYIKIVLHNGYRWAKASQNQKIQPLYGAPTSYIQPGAFQYKFTVSGSVVEVTLPKSSTATHFGIHADVQRLLP